MQQKSWIDILCQVKYPLGEALKKDIRSMHKRYKNNGRRMNDEH